MWLYEGIIETMKENWVWNLFMALEVSEGYWSRLYSWSDFDYQINADQQNPT